MRPTLIHKIRIEIQNKDNVTTIQNPVWGEVEGNVLYQESFVIYGQIKFFTLEELQEFANGFQMTGKGYINIYPEDAEKILDGAKIIKIGRRTVDFYIKDNSQFAHYDDAELMRFVFDTKDKGIK